jgi:hypothetical protein
LVVVVLLALGDYLLWNWSLSANHDVLALVSGMTLIPLLIALTWLLVLAVARLIAHTVQRPRTRSGVGRHARVRPPVEAPERREKAAALRDPIGAGEAPTASPSSKLAA